MAAVAIPAAMATLVIVLFAAFEIGGHAPLTIAPNNIAEAAAMGNAAETMRRLMYGETPFRVEDVRPEITSADATRLTALEGTILSRQLALVRLLDERGLIVSAAARQALACLARDVRADDIVDYLAPKLALSCEAGAARQAIAARAPVDHR